MSSKTAENDNVQLDFLDWYPLRESLLDQLIETVNIRTDSSGELISIAVERA